MDLTRAVTITRNAESFELNDAALSAGAVIAGCAVTMCDYSELQVRQNTEKFPKADGIDVGGVWVGGRTVRMSGVLYASSRGALQAAIANLTTALTPISGTYGVSVLHWKMPLTGGIADATLNVRPNGPRFRYDRATQGLPNLPVAIPWEVTMLALDPYITVLIPTPCVTDHFLRTLSGDPGTGPLGTWNFSWGDTATISVDGDNYVAVLDGRNFPGDRSFMNVTSYTFDMGIAFTMSMKFRFSSITGASADTVGNISLNDYNNGAGAFIRIHNDLDPIIGLSSSEFTVLPAFVVDTDYILVLGVHYVTGIQKAKVYKVADADPGWQVTGTCLVNPWPNSTDPGVQPQVNLIWEEANANTIKLDYVRVCPGGVDF